MLNEFFLAHGLGLLTTGWMQFAGAFAVAFAIMMLFGRPFINAMRHWQGKGQPISENVPESHRAKAGTPTMGGVLMVIAILVGALLFMPMDGRMGWVALASVVMFGALGFADDYKKVVGQSKKASNGLSPALRLTVEAIFVVILAYFINKSMPEYIQPYSISIPFGGIVLQLGLLYFVFAYFVICGGANATNITDGLDGMLSS